MAPIAEHTGAGMRAEQDQELTMTSKYTDVIARLQKATGPDAELDARIWVTLAGVKYVSHNKPYGDMLGRTQVCYTEPPKRTKQVTNPPRMPHAEPVTSSIDAAIALVERMLPGCWWRVSQAGVAEIETAQNAFYDAQAETPQAGLLIALFRALEIKDGEGQARA